MNELACRYLLTWINIKNKPTVAATMCQIWFRSLKGTPLGISYHCLYCFQILAKLHVLSCPFPGPNPNSQVVTLTSITSSISSQTVGWSRVLAGPLVCIAVLGKLYTSVHTQWASQLLLMQLRSAVLRKLIFNSKNHWKLA
jgi:hypothetical protein